MGYIDQSAHSPLVVTRRETSPQQAISEHFGACRCGDQYVHAWDS